MKLRIGHNSNYLPILLSVPLALVGALALHYALAVPHWYQSLAGDYPMVAAYLERVGTPVWCYYLAAMLLAGGGIAWAALSILGLFRNRLALTGIRFGYVSLYVILVYVMWAIWTRHADIAATELSLLPVPVEPGERFMLWLSQSWLLIAVGVGTVLLHIVTYRRKTQVTYRVAPEGGPMIGDRIFENMRTWGPDPSFRMSWSGTIMGIVALILLYWLSTLIGCMKRIELPQGSGNPVVALVQVVKPQEKKKKKFLLNPNSPIILEAPDLDQSKILKEVAEATEVTYEASTNVHGGPMGEGGGESGGWPNGVPGGVFPLIRLAHGASGERDGMTADGYNGSADLNFLNYLRKQVPFKVANRSEIVTIRELTRYEKGYAPPFLLMTGDGSFRLSTAEQKILREYALDGGLIFASAGDKSWHNSFTAAMRQTFPGKPLQTISDDHPQLFSQPYQFPNGAPALWAHGGRSVRGVTHKGRIVVFYHPGDLVDAWKDRSISGLSPDLATASYQLGINVAYYAVTNYLRETEKYRK